MKVITGPATNKIKCFRCSMIRDKGDFSFREHTGELYLTCDECRIKRYGTEATRVKERPLTPAELRAELWDEYYPIWQSYGHQEATAPMSEHDCNSPIVASQLAGTADAKDDEVILYCIQCLVMWRTGIYSPRSNVAESTYIDVTDALYGSKS